MSHDNKANSDQQTEPTPEVEPAETPTTAAQKTSPEQPGIFCNDPNSLLNVTPLGE